MDLIHIGEIGQLETTAYTCTIWKIENFSEKCSKAGEYITSPFFQSCPKLNLKLYPYGNTQDSKDYLSLFLIYTPYLTTTEYEFSFEMAIRHDGSQIDNSTKHFVEYKKFSIDVDCSWGWPKFIKRSELFKKEATLLKKGTLIISCSVSLTHSKVIDPPIQSLNTGFESLFHTGDFSDVTVAIDDKKINVHKAILSSRSNVFSAMFKNDMSESNTNVVRICDVGYDVMEKFLLFLYSGKVDNVNDYAKSLLPVADKYEVCDLKELCEAALLKSLKIDNACEILRMADLYNCSMLRSRSIDFIIANVKNLIKTKDFEDLSSSYQTLFKEIFYKIVEEKL